VDVAAFIAKKLSGGYVAVLSPNAFTLFVYPHIGKSVKLHSNTPRNSQTILLLETGPVVGAVVLDPAVFPGEPVQPFSPQTHFPQESSSIHEAHTDWNPAGQSMLSHDFKFPVYNLNAQDSATVWEKANDNRVNDGTWGAELSTFMWAGGNAEICLRRSMLTSFHLAFCAIYRDNNFFWSYLLQSIASRLEVSLFGLRSLPQLTQSRKSLWSCLPWIPHPYFTAVLQELILICRD
jgi:hypothetical protein